MKNNEYYMGVALKEANKAKRYKDIPVGCVIVKNGKIIAKAHNKREKDHLVSGHAEMIALAKANKRVRDWQLVDAEMYVTLEPCLMCAAAIIQSRIKTIYFGAYNEKYSTFAKNSEVLQGLSQEKIPEIVPGIRKEECEKLIKVFFKSIRYMK